MKHSQRDVNRVKNAVLSAKLGTEYSALGLQSAIEHLHRMLTIQFLLTMLIIRTSSSTFIDKHSLCEYDMFGAH